MVKYAEQLGPDFYSRHTLVIMSAYFLCTPPGINTSGTHLQEIMEAEIALPSKII